MSKSLITQIQNQIAQILLNCKKMKIQGIGVDIIEIKRIKSIAKKRGSFLSRVFTEEEIKYCQRKKNPWQHLAVRFAAKEAIWKTLGKNRVSLKNISIKNEPSGKPKVFLNGKEKRNIYLSLSHCQEYALAQALLVKE